MLVKILLDLRHLTFCAFYAIKNPFSIPSSQHILLFRQTLLLQILQMYRKLSLTNYSYQVQYSTSNLGHNKVSVLCRQLARHIHKYEEL